MPVPDLKEIREQLRNMQLGRALRLVWSSAPGWTVVNLSLVVVQGLLPLASLYVMKRIVDTVATALSATADPAAIQEAMLWIILAAVLGAVTALVRSLSAYATEAQGLLVTDAVSDTLHAQSIAVDLEYYESPTYYDALHRAQQDAAFRPTRILDSLVQIAQSCISLVGIASIIFASSPLVAVILFVAAVPGAIIRLVYARRLYSYEREQTSAEREAWYYHMMLTDATHAKEVRLFGLGALFSDRFRALRRRLREGRLALSRRRSVSDLMAQTFTSLAVFGTLAIVAKDAIAGTLSLGGLVMYYQGFQSGLGFFRTILGSVASLYEDSLFLGNYYRFLELTPRMEAPDHAQAVPTPLRQGLRFSAVEFRYPTSEQDALHSIDISLAPGEVIALVGENGSGKTTLIKLLCRLYDPSSGSVTVDGIDLQKLDPVAWRHQISVIFQDFARYYLSVRENIWLGNVELAPDSQEIAEAARLSGADRVIERLPKGYETMLGYWFDEGHELSTGEWQKVALARAFLRHSQIVILDEPTSSLDPLAEAELFQRFKELIKGRSAIIISHRFSTVQMADRIYVMDRGRVVESGTHQALLERDGLYARMYRAQAASYLPADYSPTTQGGAK